MVKQIVENAGRGLVAGIIGTAAMTAASTLEMNLRGREGSTTPADAATKVLGIEMKDDASKATFSNLVHWGYGTAWGVARGLLGAAGLTGLPATALHFASVWGTALVMLPSLRVAPPPTEWGAEEVAIDALHHVVYVAAAGVAFDWLSSRDR